MVARIPAARNRAAELFGLKLADQPEYHRPRPAPQAVFVTKAKGGPRGGEGNDLRSRPEAGAHFLRERLGEDGDGVFFRRRLNERGGDDQISQPPQFNDEQFWFHRAPNIPWL